MTTPFACRPRRRFYAAQPTLQHLEKNVLLDDLKRREREAKERAAEANMLDSLYTVRRPDSSNSPSSTSAGPHACM